MFKNLTLIIDQFNLQNFRTASVAKITKYHSLLHQNNYLIDSMVLSRKFDNLKFISQSKLKDAENRLGIVASKEPSFDELLYGRDYNFSKNNLLENALETDNGKIDTESFSKDHTYSYRRKILVTCFSILSVERLNSVLRTILINSRSTLSIEYLKAIACLRTVDRDFVKLAFRKVLSEKSLKEAKKASKIDTELDSMPQAVGE